MLNVCGGLTADKTDNNMDIYQAKNKIEMLSYNITTEAGDNLIIIKKSDAMEILADLASESNDIHNVVPFIGTAVFKKNNYSKIKNLTIGKMYGITKRHDRSKIRVYRPNMNDGFYITNDIGKEVVFTNMNMWDVYWV